jgi:hypothetical protein
MSFMSFLIGSNTCIVLSSPFFIFFNESKLTFRFVDSKLEPSWDVINLIMFSRAIKIFFCCGAATQWWSWPPHSWGFLEHTQRRTTVGRIPLDEWSARHEWSVRRRDLYLTIHNTHNRQTSMPSVEFEPTISAGERPQTYALDRAATGTGD